MSLMGHRTVGTYITPRTIAIATELHDWTIVLAPLETNFCFHK